MLRKFYFVLSVLFLFAGSQVLAQTGTISGKIIDKNTKEPLPFANVVAELNGTQMGGGQSDFDGKFTIKPLAPGRYTLKASFVGYAPLEITGVLVSSDKITFQDLGLSQGIDIKTVVIEQYKNPLIDKGNPSTQTTITSEEIKVAPTRDVRSVASTTAGVYQQDEGDALNVRGSRSDATEYYIDGIKVRGSTNIPNSGIEQITVVQGGVPAQYGDATGGIINITTRGPSKEYFGGIEVISSDLFDEYDYRLAGLNVSGPLIMRKEDGVKTKNPLAGFFIAAEYQSEADPDPSSVDVYKLRSDVKDRLEANPVRYSLTSAGGIQGINESLYLNNNDFETGRAKLNVGNEAYRVNGKLDYQPTRNINLSFGGSYDHLSRHDYIRTYALFNSDNNSQTIQNTWRVFARFTQKFGSGDGTEKSASALKNAFYSIQADYSKYDQTQQDEDHKDNLFNYGYIGKFETYKSYNFASLWIQDSVFDPQSQTMVVANVQQANPQDSIVYFTAGSVNPVASNYTSTYYDFVNGNGLSVAGNTNNLSSITGNGALINGQRASSSFGKWLPQGRQFNGYQIIDQSQFRVSASGSADIKNHAIVLGLEYEQRIDRGYSTAPIGLWGTMRSLANAKNGNLDLNAPMYVYDSNGQLVSVYYPRAYSGTYNADGTPVARGFYENIRNQLGKSMIDFVDIDSYDPSTFSLDLFTPQELYDAALVSRYFTYGYDVTGNKLSSNPSLNDFFTKQDDYQNFLRPIGAFEPIYMAGYIQDKFAFNDLIFNVGVRVDRYDANQPVLTDKYTIFPAYTVGEKPLYDELGNQISAPSNIGQDFVVYIRDLKDALPVPVGYRDGDTWYNASGAVINDPKVIEQLSAAGITPYLKNYTTKPNAKIDLTEESFSDYDPQINVMPRIAFSFPISDEALFFAHYDLLTQRPPARNRFRPNDYLYIESDAINNVLYNPDLKPEKTTDYEIGFKQKISRSSAFTLSAFYRELRDMIQLVNLTYAYPNAYSTYDNIDFGTVKGLSFSYDLRRTNNVRLTANYTLQFADGTGSSDVTALNLINSGQPNLRSLAPLDFDQRHTLVTSIDYRYGSGADYNGPMWFDKQFFADAGLNIILRAGSGTPYTRRSTAPPLTSSSVQNPKVVGQINGSRLPWQFRLDAKLDKDFELKWGKTDDNKRSAYLNVYVLVQNVLDAANIINVYDYTGNPEDDGALAAPENQSVIANSPCADCLVDQYRIFANNPDNYSLPRRARLGVSLNF